MSRDLADLARSIIDANLYLTLSTADRDGPPWVSPVYFGTADYVDDYFTSVNGLQRPPRRRRSPRRLDLSAAESGRRGYRREFGRRLGLLFRHRRTLHAPLLAGRLSCGQY
jgi:Pyridoxamine 5'-phosphate oxidase